LLVYSGTNSIDINLGNNVTFSQFPALTLGSVLVLFAGIVQASDSDLLINYDLKPRFLESAFSPSETNQLDKAEFNTGLGLALGNRLLDFSADYSFQGSLKRDGETDQGQLSQSLKASIRSIVLNDWLAVDAVVDADTAFMDGGDVYHYKITPSFSRPIYDLADLSVQYNYLLAKPSSAGLVKETKGYALDLNGAMANGRLIWQGTYSDSSVFKGEAVLAESTEKIDFSSSYRLIKDLYLDISSTIKNRMMPGRAEDSSFSEKHYGAGISWSLLDKYSFALNVNKTDKSRPGRDQYYGGAVTWTPKKDFELSLDYGNQLEDGTRGLVFSTKVDLEGS
jgi:hypothetical protein